MKKTMGWWVVASALVLGACGSASSETAHVEEDHHEHASGGESTGPLVPPGQATIGDRSTCTVSGEEITITEATPHVEHDGRTYYFCCPHCVERFQANPHEFLPEGHEAEATPSES